MADTKQNSYKARSIQVFQDVEKLDKHLILTTLPDIKKSKIVPLSTLISVKELVNFSRDYDIYNLKLDEIYKKVKKWRRRLEKNPKLLLSDLQHDLIIGSTLGDANIRRRKLKSNFRVSHSKKQTKYLLWKYDVLKDFCSIKPMWDLRERFGNYVETMGFSTITHYVFNYYRNLFYKGGTKKITRELLNLLNSRSLAVWLCDDGSYDNKQGYIIFCTNSFSLEEHKIMKEYFNEVWGLDPTIGFRDKKYYYLRFKQEDSKKLINIVKPHIKKFMKYKIGEKNV